MKPDMQFAHAQIRSSEEDDGALVIEGVASTGKLDRANDYVDQKTLKTATRNFTTRTLFHMHNWAAPIGRVLHMEHTDNEMLIRADVGKDFNIPVMTGFGGVVMSVNDIRKQIEQGVVNAFSIGFTADAKHELDEDGYPDRTKPKTLMVKELLEISVVSIPANKDCLFSMAKSYRFDELHALYHDIQNRQIELFEPAGNGDGKPSEGDEDWDAVIGGLDECLKKLKEW